jgi:hypothetical protein
VCVARPSRPEAGFAGREARSGLHVHDAEGGARGGTTGVPHVEPPRPDSNGRAWVRSPLLSSSELRGETVTGAHRARGRRPASPAGRSTAGDQCATLKEGARGGTTGSPTSGRRQQGSNLRTQLDAPRRSRALPYHSAMPPGARPGVHLAGTRGARRDGCAILVGSGSGRRGSRTPKPLRAARFRDGVPRRWQSFRGSTVGWRERGPGRHRTCNPPVKSRELCLLSYGAVCIERGRQGSNLRRPAFQTGALPR